MDYCSTCRRHLNGALACPGCGSYAPGIAPLADGTPAPGAAAWQAPSHLWHDAEPGAEEFSEAPQEHPYDGPDSPSPTPMGRAARRRQRERWRKTQRRALVATAVALVGGGLTVASMDRQSTDRTQAASAPDREAMGIAEEQATESTPASSTPTETRRSQRTSSATRSSTTNAPREQSAAAPQATPTTQAIQQASGTTPDDSGVLCRVAGRLHGVRCHEHRYGDDGLAHALGHRQHQHLKHGHLAGDHLTVRLLLAVRALPARAGLHQLIPRTSVDPVSSTGPTS